MFTKLVIFLAIGCTVTIATSIQGNKQHGIIRRQPRSIFDTLGSWTNKAANAAAYPYRKVHDILVQTGQGIGDYGAGKIKQLRQKYHEIKSAFQKKIDAIKNDIIKRAIGELQKVIDTLAHVGDIKTSCIGIKQTNQELKLAAQKALDELEQDLEKAVEAELKNFKDNLDNWQIEAENVIIETKGSYSPDEI